MTPWRGITSWFEAGEAVKYIATRSDVGAMIPDYRGGLSFARGIGYLLGSDGGFFVETNDDGGFVSCFQNDMLLYSQNCAGYTFGKSGILGGFQGQLLWNFNGTVDRLGQYWANFVESGPGVRFKFQSLPKSMLFSVSFLRGVHHQSGQSAPS
jgi:hypothetical protein